MGTKCLTDVLDMQRDEEQRRAVNTVYGHIIGSGNGLTEAEISYQSISPRVLGSSHILHASYVAHAIKVLEKNKLIVADNEMVYRTR